MVRVDIPLDVTKSDWDIMLEWAYNHFGYSSEGSLRFTNSNEMCFHKILCFMYEEDAIAFKLKFGI